jgi:tRNA(fMet)-specific endonuclease VapC
MIFLLDTDTCSAHMRRPTRLAHRFIQYTGGLAISTIVLGELYAGAHKHPNPPKLLTLVANLLQEVDVLDFDAPCAHEFGRVRGTLLKQGISVSRMDFMIGSVALVHNLTLVTHNTADFQNIPGLRLDDWLTP